jgi:hypothetical protein
MASTTHDERWLEDLWPVDEEAELLWRARRGRRIAVRSAGWVCLAAIVALSARMARSTGARDEMLAWGTLGRITSPSAGPVVPPASVGPQEALAASDAVPDAGPALDLATADAEAPVQAAQDAGASISARVTVRAPASIVRRTARHVDRSGSARDSRADHPDDATRAPRAPVIAAPPPPVIDDPYEDDTRRGKEDDRFTDPYGP